MKNYTSIGNIKENFDTIIFNTDWYKYFNKPVIFFGKDRPAIPEDLIHIILDNNIKIFGCDLPSVDESSSIGKPVHNKLLSNDVIIYESLSNLCQLPMLVPFQFYGFPLSFKNLDGSPVRAVGILN